MRALLNIKTKKLIILEPGQDVKEILATLPANEKWEYVCEEQELVEMELQDTDTGLYERQRRAEIDEADEDRLIINLKPKRSGTPMKNMVECGKCGRLCQVEGEYPKFGAWCEKCKDYANCNIIEYTTDHLASKVDSDYERQKEEKMK